MSRNAAVTVHVQFKDGTTRDGVRVSVGGSTHTTNRNGDVVFSGLTAGHTYTASCRNTSERFTAGRVAKVVLTVN